MAKQLRMKLTACDVEGILQLGSKFYGSAGINYVALIGFTSARMNIARHNSHDD